MVRRGRLAERLDQEARLRQGVRVALERPVQAPEPHRQPAALERVVRLLRGEIVADLERSLVPGREAARRLQRVHDADAEAPAGLEHAPRLPQRAVEVVDVHQRVEGDRRVE